MAQVRPRSSSPTVDETNHKRPKTSHDADVISDVAAQFAASLFDPSNVDQLCTSYSDSSPFKHVVIDALFRDDLLRSVKEECISHLSFTEKETDIYKINQTGDLASLSYLSDEQRALFPNLLALRDALYSLRFRTFLQEVTGCGPLSGTTQDMSVNSYTRGCHLLNHDDVIGTRRVSYILYMPLPHDKPWRTEYGGALEALSCTRSWNQFVFFEVQPGKSFHSVEEVVVDKQGHVRLSISGWFHAAQPGEEGYVAEVLQEPASSREQLTSGSSASTCAGTFTQYDDTSDDTEPPHPDIPLSPAYTSFLANYLNPAYLQLRTMKTIMAKFVNESNIQLQAFLADELAIALEDGFAYADEEDGLNAVSRSRWIVKGPPHKWCYCTLAKEYEPADPSTARAIAEGILRELQDTLFPSAAFRAWLTIVTKLIPLSSAVEARRFRPGLDYTLATSDEGESRLDVVLGLTPQVSPMPTESEGEVGRGKAKAKAKESEDGDGDEERPTGVASRGVGRLGGTSFRACVSCDICSRPCCDQCYMSPHDEEDDPAVYRSGSSKKSQANERTKTSNASGSNNVDDDMDGDEEEEDGTLLTWQPHFNCLLLVLRDEGVLRFVKYVSAAAPGSRWDICSEVEVGMDDDDDDDDGEGDKEA
ncbi:Oxoglutarate and iron-dependent oxygenase degradation, partial [Chiua virens]